METSFGRYELVDKIGTGGMAEVYRAKSVGAEGLEKDLVIKRILPEYARNERFVEMFITEADIAVGLNHPNIVQIYDFGKVDGDYYLAMEYVDGPNLHGILQAGRSAGEPMSIGEAVYVAIEVAKGLHYAHRRRDEYGEPLEIVHRDISPQNILVSSDGAVKIVDFGIAKATNAAEREPEVVKGKFRYMSPEQAKGEALDARSDLFSLGVVLFEMVCGQRLFDQGTANETLSLVKSAVVPDISSLNRDIPEKLELLLYKVLERDPDDRFQNARELQVELTQVLYNLGEIHDAMTLTSHLRRVEPHLGGGDNTRTSGSINSTPTGTSVLRTATQTTANAGETEGATGPTGTMATPTDTVFQEEPDQQPSGKLAARERKEAVFIQGRVDGLLELKTVIDEHRTWIQVLDEYTRIVDSITFKNDGRVHHVDETGFMIVLGLPVSSQNDAVRGMRVAMDLREAVQGMNLSLPSPIRLSIGVAIGDVVVEQEETGGRPRYNWSFYGESYEDAGNLGRLAMDGEILLSRAVERRIRRDFDCERLEGEDAGSPAAGEAATKAFRLLGPKSPGDRIEEVRRSYRSFYGRELELKLLRERFREAVIDEQASGVVLMGEQGIGKSTLIEEFLDGLASREVRLLRAAVTPFDRDVPLGSLADLLIELMRLGDRSQLRRLRSRLETRVDALFPEVDATEREFLLHSLSDLFNVGYPEGRFSELDRDERRGRIFLSIERVLERFAEHKPVVFAIDDAHHIDSVSLQFARQFFNERRKVPAFFVLTADSTGRHTESARWQEFLQAKSISAEHLDELNESEARSLIGGLIRAQGGRSEQLVEEVYRLSGGNPLYIKEVIAVLRDHGNLKSLGEWGRSGEGGEPPNWLPASVEEFLAAKIDRLELPLKVLLKRVSLLWAPFSVDDAGLVSEDEPLDRLEELVRQGVLERSDEPSGVQPETFDPESIPPENRRYRFANALTREVASRTLLPEEARELHSAIAEHLVTRTAEPGVSEQARMARHFEGAGRPDEAVGHYLRAADTALEQTGAAESLRLANKVLELSEGNARRAFEAHRIRQRALSMLGEPEKARQALKALEELAAEVAEATERAEVLLRFAEFHVDRGEFDEGREYTRRARKAAADAGHDGEDSGEENGEGKEGGGDLQRAESWYYEAGMLMTEGDREGALEMTERAIEVYAGADGREEGRKARRGLARCQNMKGIILRRAGRHEAALEVYDEALEHARGVDDGKLKRYVLNNSGLALVYLGQYSEALERYKRALEQCRRLGHRLDQAEYSINIGHAYYLLGRTEEAVSTIRRGIYRARQSGVNGDIANGLISLGHCYLAQGKLQAADRTLHEGLRIADSIPEAYFGIHAMFALARVRLAAGTAQDARTALLQAEDGLDRSGEAQMDWGLPYGRMLMARAYHSLGQREEAIETSRRAVEMLEEVTAYGEPAILYHHARILPDGEAYEEERRDAIRRARDIVVERKKHIDEEYRQSYLNRSINQRILNTAKLLDAED